MINKLISAVIAFLVGAIASHTYWYQANLRLQRHHTGELDRMFTRTYDGAYSEGFNHGVISESLVKILNPDKV